MSSRFNLLANYGLLWSLNRSYPLIDIKETTQYNMCAVLLMEVIGFREFRKSPAWMATFY